MVNWGWVELGLAYLEMGQNALLMRSRLFLGGIPRNFKIFIFEPKLQKLGEFSDFHEFTHYMIFANFVKMGISIMTIFVKNSEKIFVCDFSSKMTISARKRKC